MTGVEKSNRCGRTGEDVLLSCSFAFYDSRGEDESCFPDLGPNFRGQVCEDLKCGRRRCRVGDDG